MNKLGLYIHIPFCERKCNYCDFYSIVKTEDIEKGYVIALLNEIRGYKRICEEYIVDSIFIGGGTPSYLSCDNMSLILQEIKNNFTIDDNAEISMEANPNSITWDKAICYKKMGINRISVGIQSLDNDVLKIIGRLHNNDEAINALRTIKKAGITNINADVMFNIPKQSLESVKDTIKRIMAEDITHISFYSLRLEQGTPLYKMEEKGLITMAEDEDERQMYYEGRAIMQENGYMQYEISNFCKKGFECKHNIKYWTGKPYIGFGPYAHSYFDNKRYNNISDLKLYINSTDVKQYRHLNEVLSIEGMRFEYIMLGLRMNRGISISEYNKKFNSSFLEQYKLQIENLLKYKLIQIDNDIIRLTLKGIDISNYVFEQFLE